jgi:hypothetical protein
MTSRQIILLSSLTQDHQVYFRQSTGAKMLEMTPDSLLERFPNEAMKNIPPGMLSTGGGSIPEHHGVVNLVPRKKLKAKIGVA